MTSGSRSKWLRIDERLCVATSRHDNSENTQLSGSRLPANVRSRGRSWKRGRGQLGDDVRRADREGGIAMVSRQSSMWRRWQTLRTWRAMSAAIVILGLGLALSALSYLSAHAESVDKPKIEWAAKGTDAKGANTVVLSDSQLQMINVGAVSEYTFPLQREAVGNIDFNEDLETQVFPPYQGRISQLFAKLGDNVAKGQLLFTIESPDLIQAESTLIGAAGVLDLTGKALERAKQLHDVQGIADKDLEQAISDQQTAEGALRAARDGVAVFGKNPSDIDRMVRTRTIDPYLVVLSPVSGRVTARNAAPGVFVRSEG